MVRLPRRRGRRCAQILAATLPLFPLLWLLGACLPASTPAVPTVSRSTTAATPANPPAAMPSPVTGGRLPLVNAPASATSTPTRPPPTATPTSAPSFTPTPAPVTGLERLPEVRLTVPILMYHHVGPLPAGADAIRSDLTVAADQFVAHLNYLQAQGYQTLSLAELAEALAGRRSLPPRPVVLTFDDGYRDNYEVAFPQLAQRGLVATFFVVSSLVGQAEYVSWDQLRIMQGAGMAVEGHARTHSDLSQMSRAAVVEQATSCRQAIAANVGQAPRFFAYPSGRYNATTIDALRASGYVLAVTTTPGSRHTSRRPYELPRLRVRRATTVADLGALLTRV